MMFFTGQKGDPKENQDYFPDDWRFPAQEDAVWTLPKNFELTPMVFAHGLMASISDHLCVPRELASHGYIVFSLAMVDGSGTYTEMQDGTPVPMDTTKNPAGVAKDRKEMLENRVTTVK